jgi:hypothetical protein
MPICGDPSQCSACFGVTRNGRVTLQIATNGRPLRGPATTCITMQLFGHNSDRTTAMSIDRVHRQFQVMQLIEGVPDLASA